MRRHRVHLRHRPPAADDQRLRPRLASAASRAAASGGGAPRALSEDPRNIVYLTNEYDANGRVFRQTQADTTTYQLAYTLDGSGRVTQTDITNPRGYVDRLTFNTAGYPTSHVVAVGTPLARTTTFTLQTGTNLVTRITDPLNRQTDYAYDTTGNLTGVTRLAGTSDAVTTTFTYESAFNQVASVTDPLNHATSFGYDTLGRLTTITDPLSHQTTFTYNGVGQPLTATTALNQTTAFGYDLGDLISITGPLGGTTVCFVDAAGRVGLVTDPAGRQTRYEYNALNLVTKVIDPLGGETTFTYDGNGNLLTLTDPRGKTTTYTYNTMDRAETRTDPLLRAESYLYDNNGNLRQVTDRKNQVTTFTYDALDLQSFVGFGTTGNPPTYQSTISSTYDAGDRLTQVVDSGAGTITRGYDLLDRLTSETTPEGSVSYTYDGADRRATMTVAGQTALSYSYDSADRFTGLTQGGLSVTIAYDDANRRTSLTLPNGVAIEYGYDTDSRLTGLTYKLGQTTLGTLTYAYGTSGQRTGIAGTWARTNLPTALTSATYDNANQVATFGGTTFSYDANGNLTGDGTRTYTWNARDQLASLAGPVAASFAYDGLGRRRSKTVGGSTTQFLYDGLNPVQELAGASPSANLLTGLGIDEFFTRTDSVGARHYLADVLGSTVALSDGAGAVQTEYTYEPFGALTTGGAITNSPFAFTGREADGTGLLYYRARFHDPRLQRFISEDPVEFAAGDSNLHAYVRNAPAMFSDPLGLKPSPRFGPGPGIRGLGPRPGKRSGPGISPPNDTRPDNPDKPPCDGFWKRWLDDFLATNGLPGAGTVSGLNKGLRVYETFLELARVPVPQPVGIFSAPAPTSRVVLAAVRVTGFAWVTAAFEIGVAFGSAIDAGLLHPCAGF